MLGGRQQEDVVLLHGEELITELVMLEEKGRCLRRGMGTDHYEIEDRLSQVAETRIATLLRVESMHQPHQ